MKDGPEGHFSRQGIEGLPHRERAMVASHALVPVIAIGSSIYLQRVALPGTPIGLGALIPYLGLAFFAITGRLQLRTKMLAFGLALFAVLGFSTIVSGTYSPIPSTGASLGLVVLMWAPFMFAVNWRETRAAGIVKIFQYAMVPIALLTALQFLLQANFPQWLDPISLLPGSWLIPGYQAAYEFQYGSGVLKANGVFFLESSFASQYLALAALGSLKARQWMAPLFIIALVMTGGGTGIIMLLVGVAVYAAKGSLKTRLFTLASVCTGALVMSWLGLAEQILGRAGELRGDNTSGSQRFVLPYETVVTAFETISDSIFWGLGPGSSDAFAASIGIRANFALIPKLLIEYGTVATIVFVLAVVCIVMRLRLDFALKLPICIMIVFLSGALIQAHTSLLLWVFAACLPVHQLDQPATSRFRTGSTL